MDQRVIGSLEMSKDQLYQDPREINLFINFRLLEHTDFQAKGRSPATVSDLNIQVIPTPKIPHEIYGPDKVCLGIPTKFKTDKPYPGTIYQWSIAGDDPENIIIGKEAYLSIFKNNSEVELRRITLEGAGCLSGPFTKSSISQKIRNHPL